MDESQYQDRTPDGTLVDDVLAGRTEQFGELYRRYWAPLVRVARSRLGREDWAEEAVQDAFYWAFKCLGSYDSRYSFRTWLWTILLNQCNRQFRSRQRRVPTSTGASPQDAADNVSAQPTSQPSPAEQLLAKERNALLHRHLADLPAAQADALRLRFFGGLKFQEIADVMGCSLSGAKHRVRCGLAALSAHLGEASQQISQRSLSRQAPSQRTSVVVDQSVGGDSDAL